MEFPALQALAPLVTPLERCIRSDDVLPERPPWYTQQGTQIFIIAPLERYTMESFNYEYLPLHTSYSSLNV